MLKKGANLRHQQDISLKSWDAPNFKTLIIQKHEGVAILIFSFNMQVLQSPAQPTSYRVMNNQMHKKITLEGYVNASAALKK